MIAQSILGVWLFTGMIYHGQVMPPLNPSLKIFFQFNKSGIDRLYYRHEGEIGFCERTAKYILKEGSLEQPASINQTVNWVNPDNAEYCEQDTDMKLGNQSSTPVELVEDQLHLKFQMGDEELSYVWQRTTQRPTNNN